MIHGRTNGQLILEARKFGRCFPSSRRVPDVVAEKPNREYPPSARTDATGMVQCQHVKTNHVARFQCPTVNGKVLAVRLDIG